MANTRNARRTTIKQAANEVNKDEIIALAEQAGLTLVEKTIEVKGTFLEVPSLMNDLASLNTQARELLHELGVKLTPVLPDVEGSSNSKNGDEVPGLTIVNSPLAKELYGLKYDLFLQIQYLKYLLGNVQV